MNDDAAAGRSSGRRVLLTTLLALAAAIVALVIFVLPAEYGIDPTGVGARLGLTDLASTGGPTGTPADTESEDDVVDEDAVDDDENRDGDSSLAGSKAPPPMITGNYPGIPETFDFYEPDILGEPFSKGHDAAFRSDTLEIHLEEFEQVEYKAVMRRGDVLVYDWEVDEGIVYTDFHADPGEEARGYPDQYFIRYRESESGRDSGSLVAPFDGNHGWYWLNIEERPITITLRVAGYYERIDELFRSFQ